MGKFIMDNSKEKLMKPDDVCRLLGISKKTLLKYKNEGKLGVVMINARTFRYKYQDVQSMIDDSERRAA